MRHPGIILLLCTACFGYSQIEENVRVIQREIRVHVVDAKGNPIKGLKEADFLVMEDKQEYDLNVFQEIDLRNLQLGKVTMETGVSAEANQDAPAISDPPPQTSVIVFDSAYMTEDRFEVGKQAVTRLIERTRAKDRVQLVHLDAGMNVLTPFTGDQNLLKEGLARANLSSVMYRDLFRNKNDVETAQEEAALAPTNGLRGSETADLMNYWTTLELDNTMAAWRNHHQFFCYNMTAMAQSLEAIPGSKTVYLISSGRFMIYSGFSENRYNRFRTDKEAEAMNKAFNRAGATVYAMGFRRLEGREMPMEGRTAMQIGLEHITEGTGGVFQRSTVATMAADRAEEVFNTSAHYYRIGYSLFEPDENTRVNIRLIPKIPGARLRYGKDQSPKRSYLKMDEMEREIDLKGLLLYESAARNDLDVEWDVTLFYRGEKGYRIPVVGRLPKGKLPKNGFEVALAVVNENGLALDMIIAVVTDYPDRDHFSFYDLLLTDEPPAAVRCYLRNLDTGELNLQRMAFPKKEITSRTTRLSKLVFGSGERTPPIPLNHTRKVVVTKGSKAPDEGLDPRVVEDPFLVAGKLFKPADTNTFKPRETLTVMFHVEGLPPGDHDLTANFYLFDGEKVEEFPSRITGVEKKEKTVRYTAEMPADKIGPGNYQLMVRVTKKGMAGELRQSRAFAVR